MPIYEYRCSSCGAQQEALQKFSDPLLVTCARCGKDTLVKQVSAAGFQLKGSGWYVTDFRNGSKPASTGEAKKDAAADAPAADGAKKDGDAKKDAPAGTAASPKSESTSTTPAASPAAKPSSSE